MDVENAIRVFASAGHDLPRDAMRWALDNWQDAAPALLGVLERYADGVDCAEETANAVFFILHLAGERRETRAFAPLCRLMKDAKAPDTVLGDGVTTTLKRILIGTYDGDLDALKGVIEAAEADEYVRAGALEVLAYLTTTGRVTREETEASCSGSTTRCNRSARASSGSAGCRRWRSSGSRRSPASSNGRSPAA